MLEELKEMIHPICIDAKMTGNFEVYVDNPQGNLLHSKKNGGGRCDSQAERSALVAKIRAAIDNDSGSK